MTLCVDEMFLLTLIGRNFVLHRLTDHGEEERKRHDLELEKLQRATDEWNKRKAQRASIKKELIHIAWYPPRYWDWCMPEYENKETEKFFF